MRFSKKLLQLVSVKVMWQEQECYPSPKWLPGLCEKLVIIVPTSLVHKVGCKCSRKRV